MTQFITNLLAILTLIADSTLILVALCWIAVRLGFINKQLFAGITDWINLHALKLLFIIPFFGLLGSMYYSKIAHWQPCELCWYQRIMLYPQVLLIGMALVKKSRVILPYLTPLALIGAGISIFHYIEQIRVTFAGKNPLTTCGDDSGISCGTVYTFHFGYITIPIMALTAFLLVFAIIRIAQNKE